MKNSHNYTRICSTRLSGNGCLFGLLARTRVFLGEDHLLFLTGSVIKEDFKKIYYNDIQRVSLQISDHSYYLHLLLAFFSLVCGLTAFFNGILFGGSESALILALIYWLIHWLKGPTCRCEIRTNVQSMPLPIGRLRLANEAMDRLRIKIFASQENLLQSMQVQTGEAVPESSGEKRTPLPVSPAEPERRRRAMSQVEVPVGLENLLGMLAGCWLVLVVCYSMVYFYQNHLFLYLGMIAFLGTGIFNIVTIVKLRSAKPIISSGRSTWFGIIMWVFQSVVTYGYFMSYTMMHMEVSFDPTRSYLGFFEAVRQGQGGTEYLVLGLMAACAIVGVCLCYSWLVNRRRVTAMRSFP